MKSLLKTITYVLIALLAHAAAQAQSWSPTRPIRVLIAYPPGGANDANARAIAHKLTEIFKQQVIVDNRPGANGIVAGSLAAKANADGHTLFSIDIAHTANPALYNDMPYDTLKDFAPIVLTGRVPMVLLTHPAQPYRTIKELLAYARANAGKLNYGSAGVGSAMYLVAESFKTMAALDIVQIAYKGGGPALIELGGGQLPLAFISLVAGMPMVQSGRARVLGVSSLKPHPGFPDVPSISESGVPGFEFYLWQGIIGPAALPRTVVARLNSEINNVMNDREVRDRLVQAGNELVGGTPEQAGRYIRSEVERWLKTIKPEMRVSR